MNTSIVVRTYSSLTGMTHKQLSDYVMVQWVIPYWAGVVGGGGGDGCGGGGRGGGGSDGGGKNLLVKNGQTSISIE